MQWRHGSAVIAASLRAAEEREPPPPCIPSWRASSSWTDAAGGPPLPHRGWMGCVDEQVAVAAAVTRAAGKEASCRGARTMELVATHGGVV